MAAGIAIQERHSAERAADGSMVEFHLHVYCVDPVVQRSCAEPARCGFGLVVDAMAESSDLSRDCVNES